MNDNTPKPDWNPTHEDVRIDPPARLEFEGVTAQLLARTIVIEVAPDRYPVTAVYSARGLRAARPAGLTSHPMGHDDRTLP